MVCRFNLEPLCPCSCLDSFSLSPKEWPVGTTSCIFLKFVTVTGRDIEQNRSQAEKHCSPQGRNRNGLFLGWEDLRCSNTEGIRAVCRSGFIAQAYRAFTLSSPVFWSGLCRFAHPKILYLTGKRRQKHTPANAGARCGLSFSRRTDEHPR